MQPILLLMCLFAFSINLAGCGDDAKAESKVFEPPYKIDDNNRLTVREDLIPHIKSEPAEVSTASPDVVGFGHLGFAPGESYAVRAAFDSYVERVLVDLDDVVKKDQSLAELRSAGLAQARAELANANVTVRTEELAVERLEPLVRDGTAAERELVEAKARLDAARAQVAGAQSALSAAGALRGWGDRYILRASSTGRVLARTISPGERVSTDSEPLFIIGNPNALVVRASFPERDSIHLREGARCNFVIHALTGAQFEGTVTRIVRTVDPRTRATDAVCEPDANDPRFQAQMVARVSVAVETEENVVVPRSALLLRRDEPVVFVLVEPGVLERRAVVPGLQLGEKVQIVKGVKPGEEVVTAGAVLLDGELDVLL